MKNVFLVTSGDAKLIQIRKARALRIGATQGNRAVKHGAGLKVLNYLKRRMMNVPYKVEGKKVMTRKAGKWVVKQVCSSHAKAVKAMKFLYMIARQKGENV